MILLGFKLRPAAYISCVAALIGYSNIALAKDQCSDIIVKTEYRETADVFEMLSIFNSIETKSHFEKWKEVNGGLSIFGVNAKTEYSSFVDKRSQLNKKYRYNLNASESRKIATSYIPPESASAWRDCVLNAKRVVISAEDITNQAVTLFVKVDPGEMDSVGVLQIDARGSTNLEGLSGRFAPPFGTVRAGRSAIIDRVPGQELRVIVNTSTQSDFFRLPPPPQEFSGPLPSETLTAPLRILSDEKDRGFAEIQTFGRKGANITASGNVTYDQSSGGPTGWARFCFWAEADGIESPKSCSERVINFTAGGNKRSQNHPMEVSFSLLHLPDVLSEGTRIFVYGRIDGCRQNHGAAPVRPHPGQSVACYFDGDVTATVY